jgi:energy-coupling factor transporter transmembrane protein EcfT
MVNSITLFSYKNGTTVLHRLDARIKLLLIFACGYIVFSLPPVPCAVCIAFVFVLSFPAGFTFTEQLSALKPAVYYAVLLYTVSFITACASRTPLPSVFIPQKSDMILSLRLILTIQFTSILYRTTSPLALRTALEEIELSVRKFFRLKKTGNLPVSDTFSLLLVFIPRVFDVWAEISRAWKARNGKGGIRMICALFPVLISVCMKRSYLTALALRNRRQ